MYRPLGVCRLAVLIACLCGSFCSAFFVEWHMLLSTVSVPLLCHLSDGVTTCGITVRRAVDSSPRVQMCTSTSVEVIVRLLHSHAFHCVLHDGESCANFPRWHGTTCTCPLHSWEAVSARMCFHAMPLMVIERCLKRVTICARVLCTTARIVYPYGSSCLQS